MDKNNNNNNNNNNDEMKKDDNASSNNDMKDQSSGDTMTCPKCGSKMTKKGDKWVCDNCHYEKPA